MTTGPSGQSRRPLAHELVARLLSLASSVVPMDPNLMVVYGLTELEDGALATQEALVERGFVPVRLSDAAGSAARPARVRYRRKRSLGGLWSLLRANAVFTSHTLYGGVASGRGKRMVMLWHGELVKPMGLLDGDRGVAADVAPVCSGLARAFRSAEFGLDPNLIPVLGAPRNDRLLTADPADVRERLGWAPGDVIWLWLPTYRTAVRGARRSDTETSTNGLPFDEQSLHALDVQLRRHGITVVVKPHPLAEQLITGEFENIVVMRQSDLDEAELSLYEALAAVDGLITDVSSVWVDYLLTDKPMLFVFPDLEEYRRKRGFNLEPYEDWVPGPVVDDVDSWAAALVQLPADDSYAQRRSETKKRLHQHADAHSTDRLLDLLQLRVR